MIQRLFRWLETNWVTPAYSGWVLLGLTFCFLGAATNTMAGWLYVISGITIALMSVASILPQRGLQGLSIHRQMPRPVSAGTALIIEVTLENATTQDKTLLQLQDVIPESLQVPQPTRAIAMLKGQTNYIWRYEIPTQRRGIHTWSQIRLRTAAPLGLFWCTRLHTARANAVVYPHILPLEHCPIVDALGDDVARSQIQKVALNASGTEGLTRALRPYRWGDSTRLIHWRTSARYGELRVRELEVLTSHQSLIIALDTGNSWDIQGFEQAVIAAASLYQYAQRQRLAAHLWTAKTGLIQETTAVLTRLAGVQINESNQHKLPTQPLIWLTAQQGHSLPANSAAIVFATKTAAHSANSISSSGLVIDPTQDLQRQLQTTPGQHKTQNSH